MSWLQDAEGEEGARYTIDGMRIEQNQCIVTPGREAEGLTKWSN